MTTREKLTKELNRILPEITAKDKKEAIKKFKLSDATISVYLNNPSEVKNLDRLYDLIDFFNKQIIKRHDKIDILISKN